MTLRDEIEQNLPFISVITYGGEEYVGIIINQDQYVTSIYDLNAIRTADERTKFLEIGEIWWWESNRKIPINVFLKQDMQLFQYAIKTFNSKDVKLLFGPIINLNDIATKRVKRTSIRLIKKLG